MSRILLVDDSPHAQRMGERILSDEGFEVVTVSNADSALIRLDDVDPDVVLADTVMPGRTGYEICQYLKMSPRHRYVRVILTAGVLEAFDEERARQVAADGTLKKPFEASALVSAVKPLSEAAAKDRASLNRGAGAAAPAQAPKAEIPFVAVVDSEHVRAAVTVALDASLERMVDEITRRVLAAMRAGNAEPRPAEARLPEPRLAESRFADPRFAEPRLAESRFAEARSSETGSAETRFAQARSAETKLADPRVSQPRLTESGPPEPVLAPPQPEAPKPAAPAPPATRVEPVRRVTPLRIRSGSILGLDIGHPDPPAQDPE
jgi:CheY-like chemotaxis protein